MRKISFLMVFVLLLGCTGSAWADLVGYWPLDGGVAPDLSGYGNDGTINGNVTPTTDKDGNPDSAMYFNGGGGDLISVGDDASLNMTGAMTITAWVYLDSTNPVHGGRNGRILGKMDGGGQRAWSTGIEANTGGVDWPATLQVSSNGNDVISSIDDASLPLDQWVHFAGVYTPGTSMEVYLDGDLVFSKTTDVPASQYSANGHSVLIGNRPACGNCGWYGSLDEVRIYNEALSESQIEALMSGGGKLEPKVDPGPDQVITLPDTQVTLAAEIQDDGDPNEVLVYWWEVVGKPSGATVSLTNPTGLGPFTITVKEGGDVEPNEPYMVTPTVTVSQSGIYELKLNARDELNDSNDTVLIKVYPSTYTGMVAHWKLDDGVDTGPTTLIAEDSSGSWDPNWNSYGFDHHFHDGDLNGETNPGEPNWTDGVDSPLTSQDFKGALWFDGVDDFVEVDYAEGLGVTSDFTIATWIYPRDLTRFQGIITKVTDGSHKQFALSFGEKDPFDALQFDYEVGGNNYQVVGGQLIANQWQHVAVTVDSDLVITFYINGGQVASDTAPAEVAARSDNINIGRWGGTYAAQPRYFDGKIDDFRIYGVAKTVSEIIEIAGIENPPPTVDAGDSYLTWLDDLPLTTLAGTVGDGPPGDVADADVVWSITASPGGANASVTKTSSDWANPTADFTTDTVGIYEITLTATDTTGLTGSDTLEIQVVADACEAAQLVPSWTGFNVFDTDQNCVVDLIDYADFAAKWLADLRLTAPEAY